MEIDRYPKPSSGRKENQKIPNSLPTFYKSQPEMSDEETVAKELNNIFAAARRRAFLIIGVGIATTAGLIFLMSKRTPVYQGKFQLLVEPVTTSQSKLLSLITETEGDKKAIINGKDFTLDYESQIRVLQSPQMMSQIIKQIKEKYPDVTYETLIAEDNKGNLTIERPMKEDVGTRILEIAYKDKDPQKIIFVLDKIAQAYLKYSLEDRRTNINKGVKFIENQIPQVQERFNKIQNEIQNLRQKYNIIDSKNQGELLARQAYSIKSQQVENQAKLAETRGLYESLQNLISSNNMSAILAKEPFAYTQLLKEVQQLDAEIAVKSAQFREDSDPIKALRKQQQNLNQALRLEAEKLQQKLSAEINSLEARERSLNQSETLFNQKLAEFQVAARKYDDLQKQLEVTSDSLKQLLVRQETLRIEGTQQELPWELIAPPDLPRDKNGTYVKPKLNKKTLMLLAVLGLAFGIGVAVIVEIINNVFHAPEDLEEETKLPLLAIIPFAKDVKKLATKTKPIAAFSSNLSSKVASFTERAGHYLVMINNTKEQRYVDSPVIEAFRSLYTNIRLQSPDKPIQSLVIGSATPGDGKSSVAVYLAQTAAAIGQRVLLVDADLRRPKIHTKLGLPNVRGLSDIISSDIGLNEVIQKSPLEENLFVLTAGSIPSDPVKLLSSEKMRHLMEQFQAFFDLVIYDTPPLVGLADANLVAAYTDGLVMVVGLEKTDRFMVLKSLDRLSISGVEVLGLVANGVKGYKTKVYKAYQRV